MQVLWGILDFEQPDTQTMNNIVMSAVELIYCYAECLALHVKDSGVHCVAPAVVLLKKLLFSSDEAVQTASRCVFSLFFFYFNFSNQVFTHFFFLSSFSVWPYLQDCFRSLSQSRHC